MSMPATAARLRPVTVAAVLVLGIGLTGCANYDTLDPYQPAAGVQTNAPGVKVRNLMVVSDGGNMHLAGTLIADQDDTLTKIEGVALKPSGDPVGALTITPAGPVKLPSTQNAKLADKKMVVKGDVKPGGMTQLSLTFATAQPMTLVVPVVDAESADLEPTAKPTAGIEETPSASETPHS